MRSLLLLALLAVSVAATHVQFSSHRVLRLEMKTEEQLRLITDLVYSNTTRELGLDWWDEPRHIGDFADVRVPPSVSRQAEELFASYGLEWRVMIADVQALLDQQMTESCNNTNADWFSDYHTYDDTVAWVTALVNQYSSIATLEVLGQSYEGRNIYAVHVNGKGSRATKPAIFYDGGIHAREWISPATVQYILYQLVSQYGVDPQITQYVDGISWTIVPIFNVDGYVYTWTKDRMWRKTRTPNSGSSCVGTDPCRNAPAGFGGSGSSSNPCDDTYHGPYALSDPAVKVVTDALAKTANLKAYINFHSYSQLFLSPWGYTTKYPPTADYNAQTALGTAFVAAIKAKHGKVYDEGPVATTIYMASGIINDYTYDDLKVLYSYACELRDTGTYGFLLPASQIVPTGEEIFAGVLVMAQTVIKL